MIYKLFVTVLLIYSFLSFGSEKTIKIGVAHFPPYSIVEGDKISGAEVEIAQKALEKMNYKVQFISYPYGRLPTSFKEKRVDGTIVTQKNFKGLNVFYTSIVFPEYQTVAIHLKKKNFKIHQIVDLKNKSILAHQRASLYYGDDFNKISQSKVYRETARQDSQISMLFNERVDVIVLAYEIFYYFKIRSEFKETNVNYTVSRIFGDKFGFHNVFWEEKIRNDFNIGLNKIKQNGTYDKIKLKYLDSYKFLGSKVSHL